MKMQPESIAAAKKSFRLLPERVVRFVLEKVNRFSKNLVEQRANPNVITVFGLVFGLAAGFSFAWGKPLLAALSIVLCGFFDILDGKVAENSGRRSLFGAIFDSSLDRYSEFFIYFGLAYYLRHHWALWLTFFTILGSFMVSYARARAEGLGIKGNVGMMQRAERMVLLFAGAIAGAIFADLATAMVIILIIITVASHLTAWQRILFVRRQENAKSQSKEV